MSIDNKFIGREYPGLTYKVSREKIKEYVTAIGDLNPLYLDNEFAKKSEYKSIIAHPMFIVVYARDSMFQLFTDKEVTIDMNRLVHGEQEFQFHKIIKEDDEITTVGKIKNILQKGNNDFVVLETKSYNQNKELVSEGIWTFVIRG